MIGRFLELSLPADPVLDSVHFYESLGLRQAHTADLWPHHYGVVSDGRLNIGLHGARVAVPTLSWVREDVVGLARDLRAVDIAITETALEPDELNELALDDPDGFGIRVMEARSFSPLSEDDRAAPLGWFRELRLRVTDLDRSERFWEQLGMVRCGRGQRPAPRASLSCDGLNLLLVQDPGARRSALIFEHGDLDGLLADLAVRDLHPTAVQKDDAGVAWIELRAPEGMSLIVERER